MHLLGIDSAPGAGGADDRGGSALVPLVYLLGRVVLDERRARLATLLYVFAPSAVLYGATSADALYATLALLAAAAAGAGRNRPRTQPRRRAGAFAPGQLLLPRQLGRGRLGDAARRPGAGSRQAVALAAACGLALAGFYLALHAVTGYDPIGALAATESVYRAGIASRRPYEFWVFGSPGGLPRRRSGFPSPGSRCAPPAPGIRPPEALLAVLLIAAVLGFTKAETERIYLYLVPLACVAAAVTLPERRLAPC